MTTYTHTAQLPYQCIPIQIKKSRRGFKQFLQTEICEECQKSYNKEQILSPIIGIDSTKMSVETLLIEMNKKLEVIFKLEKKIDELVETVDFYSELYQEMTEFKKTAENKIKALEQRNVYIEKYNVALEERIMSLEKKEKEKNIEIACLQKNGDTENIKEVIEKFARKLNLNPEDVENVERVGSQKNGGEWPRPIVVKLRSKEARDQWLQKRKIRITNGDIYDSQVIAYKTMLCDNGIQSAIPTTATTREAIVDGRVTSSNIDHVCVRAGRARPLDARAHLLMCTLSDHYIVGISLTAAEKHSILSDGQHGFRRGRSTGTALAQFTDYVNNRLNEGKFVAVIFIDYKKAFDTLEHDVLLQAMQECGIRGPVNRWFKCYLENRYLCTTIDGTTGDDVSVTLGVPTGSVFGPVGRYVFAIFV
ncbi:uncharacterized protein LOC124533093 [Vanessa cardui]|uniref:uncharacterized protein LOC124533093 n=1 Tax=Vanessa cardui TaxID=171605 RepID=UPI001F13997D|nr:uncharacterized protein LOC124533093 [Vanessa cardui]